MILAQKISHCKQLNKFCFFFFVCHPGLLEQFTDLDSLLSLMGNLGFLLCPSLVSCLYSSSSLRETSDLKLSFKRIIITVDLNSVLQ